MNRQITGVFLLMFLLLPQFGCSTADVVSSHVLKQFLKDDPTVVRATVTAAGDVNPDARERPSPIKVRFYLLKSPKVFQNTDFFTLKEQGRELLVDDLRLYDEKVFNPGAVTTVELKLPPEETLEDEQLFLGIVAGYWNLDQATWQLTHEIEVHDTTEAAIALANRFGDRGPVFYKHKRIGQNGKPFYCVKFRSMRVDSAAVLADLLETDPVARAEWGRDQKLTNDPRIHPVGRFLRKTSLDELPQLFHESARARSSPTRPGATACISLTTVRCARGSPGPGRSVAATLSATTNGSHSMSTTCGMPRSSTISGLC